MPNRDPLAKIETIRETKSASKRVEFEGDAFEKALAIEVSRQCQLGFRAWNQSAELLKTLLESLPNSGEVPAETLTKCFGETQTILVSAGIISRILWPKPMKSSRSDLQKTTSIERGKRMAAGLRVSENSVLNDNVLRNSVEHVDERFDDFRAAVGTGVLDDFVLAVGAWPPGILPSHCARAYDVPNHEIWLFGKHRDLQAISEALFDLFASFTVTIKLVRSSTRNVSGST